jgi:hypothetical protein
VVEVCRDLVQSSSLPPGTVAARDIGVIAAFRQQVLKLRLALRAAGFRTSAWEAWRISRYHFHTTLNAQLALTGISTKWAGCSMCRMFTDIVLYFYFVFCRARR